MWIETWQDRHMGRVRRFMAYWERMRSVSPSNWPASLSDDDWEDQFEAWRGLGEPSGEGVRDGE